MTDKAKRITVPSSRTAFKGKDNAKKLDDNVEVSSKLNGKEGILYVEFQKVLNQKLKELTEAIVGNSTDRGYKIKIQHIVDSMMKLLEQNGIIGLNDKIQKIIDNQANKNSKTDNNDVSNKILSLLTDYIEQSEGSADIKNKLFVQFEEIKKEQEEQKKRDEELSDKLDKNEKSDETLKTLDTIDQQLGLLRSQTDFINRTLNMNMSNMINHMKNLSGICSLGFRGIKFVGEKLGKGIENLMSTCGDILKKVSENIFKVILKALFSPPGLFFSAVFAGLIYGLYNKFFGKLSFRGFLDIVRLVSNFLRHPVGVLKLTIVLIKSIIKTVKFIFKLTISSFKALWKITKFIGKASWLITKSLFKIIKIPFKIIGWIGSLMTKGFRWIWGKISPVVMKKIKPWIDRILNNKIVQKIIGTFKRVRKTITSIIDGIRNSKLVSSFKNIIKNVIDTIGKWGSSIKKVISSVVDTAMNVLRGIGGKVSKIVDTVKGFIKPVTDWIGKILSPVKKTVGGLAKKVGSGVGKVVGKSLGRVGGGLTGVANVAFTAMDGYDAIQKFKKGDIIGGVVKSVVTVLDALSCIPGIGWIPGTLASIIDLIYEGIVAFGDKIVEALTSVYNWIGEKTQELVNWGKEFYNNNLKEYVEPVINFISNYIIDPIKKVIDWVMDQEWFKTLMGWTEKIKESVKATITGVDNKTEQYKSEQQGIIEKTNTQAFFDILKQEDFIQKRMISLNGEISRIEQLGIVGKWMESTNLENAKSELELQEFKKQKLKELSESNEVFKAIRDANRLKIQQTNKLMSSDEMMTFLEKMQKQYEEQPKNEQTDKNLETIKEMMLELKKKVETVQKTSEDTQKSANTAAQCSAVGAGASIIGLKKKESVLEEASSSNYNMPISFSQNYHWLK